MAELNWQRTPLITIAFFLLKQLKQLVSNFSNLVPVFAAIFVGGKNSIWIPIALVSVYILWVIVSAILNQRFFLYAIDDDAVHVRSGVFNRQHLTLKYERIQQAEVHEAWYFRPFKLTILSVDSAGAAGKEVQIPGLTMALATELRQRMLAQTIKPTTEQASSSAEPEVDLQKSFPTSEIIRAGIIDNKLFVLLAVLAYPMSQLDLLEDYVVPWVEANLGWLNTEQAWLLTAAAVVGVLTLLFVAAIVVSLLTYHDLTLTLHGDRFQARSGALSIRTLSFRYPKLQAVFVRRNLRARLLKRASVRVSQLRPVTAQANGQAGGQQFVLPVVDGSFLHEFRRRLRLPQADQVHWQRLSNLALLGPSLWLAVLFPIGAAILYFAAELGVWGLLGSVALWLIVQTLVVLSWRNYGYSFVTSSTDPSEQWFVVKRGIFSRNENWYPRHKVQQIDVVQGPWLRLLGFSHLLLYTAAGAESIRYLPAEQGQQLQQDWVSEIGQQHRRWM